MQMKKIKNINWALLCKYISMFTVMILVLVGCKDMSIEDGTVETSKQLQFRTEKLFEEHYQKHVIEQKEFGNISKSEYLTRVQNLVNSNKSSVKTKTNANGDTLYYDTSTNEFAVKSNDNYIRTFFKPTDGIEYFERQ